MSSDPTVHALVVDDDRAIQRTLADALTSQGFSVTVERDGEWALKSFEMKEFDVVLLDLLLPAVNGYEVARRMRETAKGKRTPIVMISGIYKNELHQREAMERYGAAAFLEKPFKATTLFDTLKQVLGSRYPQPPAADVSQPLELSQVEKLADPIARDESQLVEKAARAPASSVSSLRGDFAQTPFPRVLAEIRRWSATGALMLRRDKVKKIVYFRDGEPQFVKSNLLAECLGRVMVKERMLSEPDCEESLRRMKASGRQQGTVLIEMGCISPANLGYALNLQLRAKLFDVFAWRNGEYQFTKRVQLPAETVNLELSTAAILYEGIRRTYDEARLREALGDVAGKYVAPSRDPLFALQGAGLGEEEHLLLEAVDGRKTVAQLRKLGVLSPLETDRLVYAMLCAQMLELADAPASGKPQVPLQFHPPPLPQGQAVSAPPPLPRPPPPNPDRAPPRNASVPWSTGHSAPGLDSGPIVGIPIDGVPIDGIPVDDFPPPPPPPAAVPPSNAVAAKQFNPASAAAPALMPELSGAHGTSDFDEGAVRERLAARVAAMRRKDFFEILGLPRSATDAQISQAYLALARENHPDRLQGTTSAEIRKLQTELYDLITTANATLSDPGERESYLHQLKSGGESRPELSEDVGRILTAEGKFQRGEELLRQKHFAAAHQAFSEAIRMYAEEGEFHAYLGWARFQMDPSSAAAANEALSSLQQAMKLNPKSDRAYLFAGYVHKALGDTRQAEAQFEKAIQANPGCAEALQELSILNWAARLGGGKRR